MFIYIRLFIESGIINLFIATAGFDIRDIAKSRNQNIEHIALQYF